MNNEQLYNKTVDILVQAYFNDTLQHEDCTKCAVGNIIAATSSITDWTGFYIGYPSSSWYSLMHRSHGGVDDEIYRQIERTGYTIDQLFLIEAAFERHGGDEHDHKMFNGLMAVIDVLDEIHENKDVLITTSVKQRFVKVPAWPTPNHTSKSLQ